MVAELCFYGKLHQSSVGRWPKKLVRGLHHMVAWEGFALKDDLVPAFGVGMVEGRHQEVQVCCQSLHDSDLGRGGAHNGCDKIGGTGIGVQPSRKRGVVQRLEVTLYPLSSPR